MLGPFWLWKKCAFTLCANCKIYWEEQLKNIEDGQTRNRETRSLTSSWKRVLRYFEIILLPFFKYHFENSRWLMFEMRVELAFCNLMNKFSALIRFFHFKSRKVKCQPFPSSLSDLLHLKCQIFELTISCKWLIE